MSLAKRGDIWPCDFWFLRRRYAGTTRQTVKADAGVCEQDAESLPVRDGGLTASRCFSSDLSP